MSETEERKSMDDVLASIRRIVRSEKEPEPVAAPDSMERPMSAPEPSEGDAPLALTPEMLMGDAESAESAVADAVTDTVAAATADVAPAAPAPSLDPEQLRDMVRDVVREELAGDQASEFVRSVIRDELMNGEIGSNISQNVMALIQSEIAKVSKS